MPRPASYRARRPPRSRCRGATPRSGPGRHRARHRRHARRRGVAGARAADWSVGLLQSAARRRDPAADARVDRLRRSLHVHRVPLRRSGSREHQDQHHPSRQHLERRLGRPEPRRAGHRPGRVSHDGEPERRAARHAADQLGRRGRVTGLGVGQRRPRRQHRLHRRDPAAAPVDPLQGRRRRADGRAVLAPCQPHRLLGVVAAAQAERVGVPAPRAARVRSAARPPDPRGDPQRRLLRLGRARHAVGVGGVRRRRLGRALGEVRRDVDDHRRRHGEPRLQPGRERRVPGRGQPALPDLLLGEAAVLHGGRRHLHPGRRRRRRRQHDLRRAHAPHRRPDRRRQGHRVAGAHDVRRAHCGRSGSRT